MMQVIFWSKDSCVYCEQAKSLLTHKFIAYEERNVSRGEWSREQLLEAAPNARTFPQVFIDGQLIGGFTDLKKHFEDQNG